MRIRFRYPLAAFALGLCVLAAVAALFFWQPVVAHLVKWTAQGYCRFCLQTNLFVEDARFQDGRLVFNQVAFEKKAKGPSWLRGEAHRVSVDAGFPSHGGLIALSIQVDTPHIEISRPATVKVPREGRFAWRSAPMQTDIRLTVNDGELLFKDPSLDHNGKFYIEGDISRNEGQFVLKSSDHGALTVAYDDSEWSIKSSMLNIADLHQAAKALGVSQLPFHIIQGNISGDFSMEWDEEDFPDMHGVVRLLDCAFESTDFRGYVPDAEFVLRDSSLAGEVSLGKGAFLEYSQAEKPSISLSQVEGKLSLPSYDCCDVQIRGLCTHHGETYTLHVGGQVKVPGQEKGSCDLEVELTAEGKEPTKACFSSLREGFGHSQCRLDVQNIGAGEWDLLMLALGTQDIGLDPYTVLNGTFDAIIKLDMEHFKAKKIDIEEFAAREVAFSLDQSDTSVKIGKARGSISLDLSAQNILDTIQASFGIDGGSVRFPAINNQHWELNNLVTQLAVENGVFKKSFIEADFMGLRGLIEVDWASDRVMSLQFQGGVGDLASLAPLAVQKALLKKSADDRIAVNADVTRRTDGLNVEGVMAVSSPGNDQPDLIQIGFTLEKTHNANLIVSPTMALLSNRLGSDVIEALAAKQMKLRDDPPSEWLKEELRGAGLALTDGWFSAPGLPTEKYIEPLFFKDGQMSLTGRADFQGRFDCDGMAVEYSGKDLLLENEELAFEMKDVGFGQPARHYFDFVKDSDYGVIPVINGTYFEKKSGLLFTDVSCFMQLKDKTIHVPSLSTTCHNVAFEGAVDFDYSSPEKKSFNIEMEVRTLSGSFGNVRDLLSHFELSTSLADFPLEGMVSLRPPGGAFSLAFRPTGCEVQGNIQGELKEGSWKSKGLEIDDISFDFDYDYEAKRLNVHKINGRINAGNLDSFYVMRDGYAHLLDMDAGVTEFNFPLFVEGREVVRMAGTTEPILHYGKNSLLQVSVNKQHSHYGGVHPEKIDIILDQDYAIDSFELQWGCCLDGWFGNFHKAGQMALKAFAPKLLNHWNSIPALKGNASLSVQYDNPSRQLNIYLEGDHIHAGDNYVKKFILDCSKKGHLWSIEQLQLDKISAAADVLPQEEGCKVNFLGCRYGDMLLMGLEGFYHYHDGIFNGRVNLLELDFSQLGQWKSFREMVSDYNPEGEMKGAGSLQVVLREEGLPQVNLDLKASLRGCALRGLHFEDTDGMSCQYSWRDKLILKECRSGLLCSANGTSQGLFGVEQAVYDFNKEELALEGLHFHTQAMNLDWIARSLTETFPEAVTPAVANIIRHVKEDDSFHGSMDVRINDDDTYVAIRLPQGKYRLGSKDHEVNNFLLEWDKKSLQVITQYRFQNTLYWMAVRSTSPEIDAGEIIISALPPEKGAAPKPYDGLIISWYMHPQHGMVVEKANGTLPGVFVDLVRDRQYPMNPYSWHLDGHIVLDPNAGSHILPPDIVEAMASWKIARNYNLHGKWIFMLEPPHDGDLYFQGKLQGHEVILKGYVVGDVSADLNCSPTQIDIANLSFQDGAGQMVIEKASMVKEHDGQWWVYAPHIGGSNLRPSLLRDTSTSQGPAKPLMITHFDIENIVCRADDLSTMTGTGKLQFSNSSKKPTNNPLLAIPAEIISRIGLNLDVLNPVSGTIFFNIEDYKVKLTKFKDVYSQGKLSKFYLHNGDTQSSVDLDGNVRVQVRMKQYNLLFKLAELFTVTIQGTLQKPVYTLQKQ